MPDFYPDALESGTLSYPAIASFYEGALIVKANRERFARHLVGLTGALYTALGALKSYRAYFTPNPCGIASFSRDGISSEELAETLSERFDIAVRGGLHCAPLIHQALGTYPSGLVRASFSPFQSMREVNALVGALKRI